jgi:hypothetical protein
MQLRKNFRTLLATVTGKKQCDEELVGAYLVVFIAVQTKMKSSDTSFEVVHRPLTPQVGDSDDAILAEISALEKYVAKAGCPSTLAVADFTIVPTGKDLSPEGSLSNVSSLSSRSSNSNDSDSEGARPRTPIDNVDPLNLAPWSPLRIKKKRTPVPVTDDASTSLGAPLDLSAPILLDPWWEYPSTSYLIVSLKNARQRDRIVEITGQDYLFL